MASLILSNSFGLLVGKSLRGCAAGSPGASIGQAAEGQVVTGAAIGEERGRSVRRVCFPRRIVQ